MAFFEDKNISIRTRVLDEPGRRPILEISFTGVHIHHWPAGQQIMAFIEAEVRRVRPAACLFDFLGYDYTFGNEIGGPIMAPLLYGGPPCPPIAIVAQGGTARSLKSLFAGSNLDKITGIEFFEDIESACAFLWWALDKREKPAAPQDDNK